ncbi:hypothetical protein AOLI_G00245010 [Acnodon oligacanthus]
MWSDSAIIWITNRFTPDIKAAAKANACRGTAAAVRPAPAPAAPHGQLTLRGKQSVTCCALRVLTDSICLNRALFLGCGAQKGSKVDFSDLSLALPAQASVKDCIRLCFSDEAEGECRCEVYECNSAR